MARSMPAAPHRVAFADAPWLHRTAVDILVKSGVDVVAAPSPTHGRHRWADIEVLVTNAVPITELDIRIMRDTRLIIRSGAGFDIVDVEAATRADIWVANVPDYCAEEVADHTILLLMASVRRLGVLASHWRTMGTWNIREQLPTVRRVRGLQLGIVGLGRIGTLVAERASAFGWRVAAADPNVSQAAMRAAGVVPMKLDQLVQTSDAVTLHCPLTPTTRHLIGDASLASAKPGLVIVNTSRGGLVDLDALQRALDSGQVAAAGLDVLDGEPRPDLAHPILTRPEVLVTSHVAWYSVEARRQLGETLAAQVLQYLRGDRPSHLIDPPSRGGGHATTRQS